MLLLVPHEIYLCMWNKQNVAASTSGIYFYVCIKFDIQAASGDLLYMLSRLLLVCVQFHIGALRAVTSVVCLCTV